MHNPVDALVLGAAAYDEQQRLETYKRQWLAYIGRSAGDQPRPVNKAAVIVDKGVSFLFGKGVSFATDDDDAENTPEEEYLERAWEANEKDEFLHRLALSGGIFGHAFVKIQTATQPGEPPSLVLLAPEYVVPTWDAKDWQHILRYRIQWTGISPDGQKPITYRQVVQEDDGGKSWTITDQESDSSYSGWRTTSTVRWLFPFAPIVDCQNLPNPHGYYGLSDLEADLLRLGDSLNWSMTNMEQIERWHGHPKTWIKGVQVNEIDAGVDGILVLPNPNSDIGNLEMQSDLSSHLARYGKMEDAYHERGRVPDIATGRAHEIAALSGRALYILYQPLIEKTQTKRLLYGNLLSKLNRRLLALAGGGLDATVKPRCIWPELLPNDPVEERNAALLDQQLGVASRETLSRKLGYDYDTEQAKMARETQARTEAAATALDRGAQQPPAGTSAADAMRASGSGG